VNKNPTDATVCRYLFTAKLHVLGVTAPNIRSIKNCTGSLQYRSDYCIPIRPQGGVAVQVV